jgi:hypothetical protein
MAVRSTDWRNVQGTNALVPDPSRPVYKISNANLLIHIDLCETAFFFFFFFFTVANLEFQP